MLTSQSDAVLIQETRGALGATHTNGFTPARKGGACFLSNKSAAQAGVLTWVGPELLAHHNVHQIATPVGLEGRVIILLCTPLPDHPGRSYTITNLYLSSGNSTARRAREIAAIQAAIPPAQYHFLAGDRNFVTEPEDTTGSAPSRDAPDARAWADMAAALDLHEVYQAEKTRYDFPKVKGRHQFRAARLDTIWISHSATDLASFRAVGSIAVTRNNILAVAARTRGGDRVTTRLADASMSTVLRAARARSSSDHMPVGLQFIAVNTDRLPATIPQWLTKHPLYKAKFAALWAQNQPPQTAPALERLEAAVATLHRAAKLTRRALRHTRVQVDDYIAESTAAAAMLRAIQRRHPDLTAANALGQRHPKLAAMLSWRVDGTVEDHKLDQHLASLMHRAFSDTVDAQLEDEFSFLQARLPQLKGGDRLKFLKAALPVTRDKLLGVWTSHTHSELVQSAHGMAKIAAAFYGDLWQARDDSPTEEAIKAYLAKGHHHEPVDSACTTDEEMMDIIMHSKNTAAGPDRIPFSAFRSAPELLGPVLAAVLRAFAAGTRPPPWFNEGRLILLPKIAGGLAEIAQTRPITISNVAARLIAKAVQVKLEPLLCTNLHASQVGCIPGRSGAEHIEAITESFYSHSEASPPQSCYLLAVDLAKAFDSVSETFLQAAFAHFGAPVWAQQAVAALHHDVTILIGPPSGPEGPQAVVKTTRGLKQGCPLSPLLFAIAMDPVLRRLNDQEGGLTTRGFVDDVIIETLVLARLAPAMTTMDEFGVVSGLKVNKAKTQLVTATPDTGPADANWLARASPWPGLKIVESATYLGVLIGHSVTLYDVHAKTVAKLTARCHEYRPALRAIPPHDRAAVLNFFLLPLLGYVLAFYPLADYARAGESSPATAAAIKAKIHRLFMPFGGTGVPYSSAVARPQEGLAAPTPIRDVWAWSSATLVGRLSETEIQAAAGQQVPPDPPWISMRPSRQKAYGLAQLMVYALSRSQQGRTRTQREVLRVQGFDPAPFALPTASARRAAAYTLFCTEHQRFLKHDKKLSAILGRRLWPDATPAAQKATPAQQAALTTNCITLHRSKATRHMKHTFWLFIHNAINTPARRRSWDHSPATTAACHFCLAAGTLNNFRHFVGQCPVLLAARRDFLARVFRADMPWAHPRSEIVRLESAYLARAASPRLVLATAVFTHAIWVALATRWQYEPSTPTATRHRHVVGLAHQNLCRVAPAAWRIPPASARAQTDTVPIDPWPHLTTAGVSAVKAYHARRAMSILEPLIRFPALHPTAIAFTDGSGQTAPNTTTLHAGAGAAIWTPTATGQRRGAAWTEMSADLGLGTNNVAELWAVGMVAEWFLRPTNHSTLPLIICTDSLLTANIMELDNAPGANVVLAHSVRTLILELKRQRPVRFLWTPGHTGIPGNEKADRLADAGAKSSIARSATEPRNPTGPYIDPTRVQTSLDIRAHLQLLVPAQSTESE